VGAAGRAGVPRVNKLTIAGVSVDATVTPDDLV
jgi:hypothetical protein